MPNLVTGLNTDPPIYGEELTPSVPAGITHLRGISFGWRVEALYAADDTGQLLEGVGPSFDLSLSADTTPAQVNHMIRSGNIDGVVYLAVGDGTGDNGFMKWLPGVAAPFWIRKTGTAAGLQIGYGGLHAPPQPERLVSSGGVGRLLSLWNGAGNDTPPAGWSNLSFDDSGWPFAQGDPSGGVNALEDGAWLWSAAGASNLTAPNEGVVFRQTFSLVTSSVSTATLSVIADDVIDSAYLNGTSIGTSITDLDVSSLLRTGSPNVLAVQAHDNLGPHGGIAFVLEVNTNV